MTAAVQVPRREGSGVPRTSRRAGLLARVLVVGLAIAGALWTPSGDVVERLYSNGAYAFMQPKLTALSNLTSFALFDVVVVVAALLVLLWLTLAIFRPKVHGLRFFVRLVVLGAQLYVAFLLVWGFNLRRKTLRESPGYDASRVNHAALVALGERAVQELNALHGRLPETWPGIQEMATTLAPAFARAHADVGTAWHVRPPVPKTSIVDLYMRRTGLNGFLAPYFLEVVVNDRLLDFERPYVIAHEWGHASGRANESEAAYIGWLTCMRGPAWAQYSAWLRISDYVMRDLSIQERAALKGKLGAGVLLDIARSNKRVAADYRALAGRVNRAGNRIAQKASRVPPGAVNYSLVVALILGHGAQATGQSGHGAQGTGQ